MKKERKTILLTVLTVITLGIFTREAQAAAWWYEQADRLQRVSATLLDGPPIAEPVPEGSFFGARVLTSLLPKPNATVGDKREKVPSAPLHAVPTFVSGIPLIQFASYTLVGTGWIGYLPLSRSLAKVAGMDVSLKQFAFGFSAENKFIIENLILTSSAGFQQSDALLSGAITSAEANDDFESTTQLFYLSQGIQSRSLPLWTNVMFLHRSVKSIFNITAERTEFVRNDNSSDLGFPFATQLSAGIYLNKYLQIGASLYHVPERLTMPRLSIVYQYQLKNLTEANVVFDN